MTDKKITRKLFHLEYKHKSGSEKHKYYLNLRQLCESNPLMRVSYSTLSKIKSLKVFDNQTVIIRVGELNIPKNNTVFVQKESLNNLKRS
jgi:hypothetical protein